MNDAVSNTSGETLINGAVGTKGSSSWSMQTKRKKKFDRWKFKYHHLLNRFFIFIMHEVSFMPGWHKINMKRFYIQLLWNVAHYHENTIHRHIRYVWGFSFSEKEKILVTTFRNSKNDFHDNNSLKQNQ